MLFSFSAYSQESSVLKNQAIYVKNFLRLIELNNENHVVIGVVGNSPIIMDMQKVFSNQGNIEIIKVSNPDEISNCDVIYVPVNNYKFMSQLTEQNNKFLLICEDEQYHNKGADISFVVENSKLQFYIDENSLKRKNISFSSQLNNYAKK